MSIDKIGEAEQTSVKHGQRDGASVNEYGMRLDLAGYAPSIMQSGYLNRCYYCGQRADFGCLGKLERVTPWGGKNRKMSNRLGMWCKMHTFCAERIATYTYLQMAMQRKAQIVAMEYYDLSVKEFKEMFGRSEVEDEGNVEFCGYEEDAEEDAAACGCEEGGVDACQIAHDGT